MNKRVWDYYSEMSFQDVIYLPDDRLSWDEGREKSPLIPRGWFELSLLSQEDRVEFTKEFWMANLPYVPTAFSGLASFFDQLEDVGVFLLLKERYYFPEMVYSLKSGFFIGSLPAPPEEIDGLLLNLDFSLPKDFLSFLAIHNGFFKAYDKGILSVNEIIQVKNELEYYLDETDKKIEANKIPIPPSSLIPFYRSAYGRSYQCFFHDWYPTNEMGNVFLSLDDHTISPFWKGSFEETLAFPTFSDWLVFYLEGIQIDEHEIEPEVKTL